MGAGVTSGIVGEPVAGESQKCVAGWSRPVPHVMRCHWRIAVFAAYIAVVACVMAFHEPWFDEAQSWLIARDASFRDMLLVRPHYEGHPPLWWLMLSVPAKLGVPYEIGLKRAIGVRRAVHGGRLLERP